ncbi:MAG: redoxin family protein, partial [Hellea sp.]|nr:redoxin family protein [Hellea sp.]
MSIQKGDKIPSTNFMTMGPDGPEPIDSETLFNGKRVALFAVPGAFTPTCSAKHLPGYK